MSLRITPATLRRTPLSNMCTLWSSCESRKRSGLQSRLSSLINILQVYPFSPFLSGYHEVESVLLLTSTVSCMLSPLHACIHLVYLRSCMLAFPYISAPCFRIVLSSTYSRLYFYSPPLFVYAFAPPASTRLCSHSHMSSHRVSNLRKVDC